jgi:hypothetical protein
MVHDHSVSHRIHVFVVAARASGQSQKHDRGALIAKLLEEAEAGE